MGRKAKEDCSLTAIDAIFRQAQLLSVTFALENFALVIDAPESAELTALLEAIAAHKQAIMLQLAEKQQRQRGHAPTGPCLLCGESSPRYYWHGRAGRWCCADCDDLFTWAHEEYARLKKIARRQAWA